MRNAAVTPIDKATQMSNPETLLEKEQGYDAWLSNKVTATLQRVADKSTPLYDHAEAMASLKERVAEKRARKRA